MAIKQLFLTSLFLLFSCIAFSQNGYQKKYAYGQYNKDWALVKTSAGTYGFVDRNSKTVVPAIYYKIEKFGQYDADLALVKSISGTYGFIDRKGKVVVPVIYELAAIKSDFKGIYNKYTK